MKIYYFVNIYYDDESYDDKNHREITLYQAIEELRKHKRWTQEELSERSGVPVSYINGLEKGRNALGLDIISKILISMGLGLVEIRYNVMLSEEQVAIDIYV